MEMTLVKSLHITEHEQHDPQQKTEQDTQKKTRIRNAAYFSFSSTLCTEPTSLLAPKNQLWYSTNTPRYSRWKYLKGLMQEVKAYGTYDVISQLVQLWVPGQQLSQLHKPQSLK
jgi:hypothetical protein